MWDRNEEGHGDSGATCLVRVPRQFKLHVDASGNTRHSYDVELDDTWLSCFTEILGDFGPEGPEPP